MFPPILFACFVILGASNHLKAQSPIPRILDSPERWLSGKVLLPPPPIRSQILFIGGIDTVIARKGPALAKQHHDFIGFTPDPTNQSLGWLSVNHETLLRDDRLGDGGGMTVFRIRRDPQSDSLQVIAQTLKDGRQGRFFNVEFEGLVGETGVNCGGITSVVDGRIWTAEEYLIPNNTALLNTGFGPGLRDTSDWVIQTDIAGDFSGQIMPRYQNFNWMVEIDPREAVAVRKQYNWGRQSFEGGVVLPDNRTVLLCEDDTPGLFTRFVADKSGDFTRGKTFVYRQSTDGTSGDWIEIDNSRLGNMLRIKELALKAGATMFNRLEWAVFDRTSGRVFISETGRDEAGTKLATGAAKGGSVPLHHRQRAARMNLKADSPDYVDFYGRILTYDPETHAIKPFLEGGPNLPHEPTAYQYPVNHLSNPDALAILHTKNNRYLVICEDLNGHSMGRVPRYVSNATCEVYLLDLNLEPKVENLKRIAVMPLGAEATGACTTPDGKTLFLNVQHPDAGNPYPYNNALTLALTGFDHLPSDYLALAPAEDGTSWLQFDAVSREIRTRESTDLALYDARGKRIRLQRQSQVLNLQDLPAGTYLVADSRGRYQAIELKP